MDESSYLSCTNSFLTTCCKLFFRINWKCPSSRRLSKNLKCISPTSADLPKCQLWSSCNTCVCSNAKHGISGEEMKEVEWNERNRKRWRKLKKSKEMKEMKEIERNRKIINSSDLLPLYFFLLPLYFFLLPLYFHSI